MRSHPLYMSTSYPLYTTTYSLYFFHHSHCICVLHPLFPWYHTLFIYDIAPTIYLTSDTLYKVSHPQFMTLCRIIYDIACTVYGAGERPRVQHSRDTLRVTRVWFSLSWHPHLLGNWILHFILFSWLFIWMAICGHEAAATVLSSTIPSYSTISHGVNMLPLVFPLLMHL